MNTENKSFATGSRNRRSYHRRCLIEQGAIPLVADKLRPEMFYVLRHQVIYAAILAMYHAGIKIDILTVKEEAFPTGGKSPKEGGRNRSGDHPIEQQGGNLRP